MPPLLKEIQCRTLKEHLLRNEGKLTACPGCGLQSVQLVKVDGKQVVYGVSEKGCRFAEHIWIRPKNDQQG
jgi:hypothetical protein